MKASTRNSGYRSKTAVNDQMQRIVGELLQQCIHEFEVDSGSVFTRDPEKQVFRLTKALGPRRNRHFGEEVGFGQGVTGAVAAKRKPLYLRDETARNALAPRKDEESARHFLSFPIVNGAEVLAVVNLSGPENGRKFGKRELRKCRMLAEKYAEILKPMMKQIPELLPEKSCYKIIGGKRVCRKKARLDSKASLYLPHCILSFDSSFSITCCNKPGELGRLLGISNPADRRRQNLLELPLEVDKEQLKEKLAELRDRRHPFKLENVRVRTFGQPVVTIYFYPAEERDDEPRGGVAVAEENNATREAQQRLLETERLSLIGSLTSVITHELSNPLDGVIRLIKLTRTSLKETETADEYLDQALQGLHRMGALMKSLGGFSRINSEPARLNAVIENALSLCKYRKDNRDIVFHLRLASENPWVNANGFHQILMNLLSNAIDAILVNPGTVTIETKLDDSYLRLLVSDNGRGISREAQSCIFDPFWTTKEYGKGTGLGLTIVKRIVERHGGTIHVESEENAGATFYLKFPKERLIIQ